MPMLHRALAFALKAHEGSDNEGEAPLPYLTHPVEVATNLRHVGGVTDEAMLCAAFLHDTVEAGTVTPQQVEQGFGPRVAGLVKELTRSEPTAAEIADLSKEEIWQLRSSMLLAEIAAMSQEAQAIKLADRLANLREAKRLKKGKKLRRYLGQSRQILTIVPEAVNPGLWRAIRQELP